MGKLSFAVFMVIALLGCKPGQGEPCESTVASDACASGLLCAAVDDVQPTPLCMTQTEAHAMCAKSSSCKQRGSCLWDGRLGCFGRTAESCKQSGACKSRGVCSLDENDICIVGGDDDCKQSENCKTLGQCKASNRLCVK